MFSVSDRISVQNALGTVRFVGHVHVWGSQTLAYGIEWDDPARGKNSGDLDGISYFTTLTAGAGSFLKAASTKISKPCSFFEAVSQRYASESNADALSEKVVFGSKTVENYGFQKLNEISNDIAHLEVIMLDHQCIRIAGDPDEMKFNEFSNNFESNHMFGAETLDLSSNLITKWSEVEKIMHYFPKLKSINLNGNRLLDDTSESTSGCIFAFPESVISVSLSATFIPAQNLSCLFFPNVTRLELSENNYEDCSLNNWQVPKKVAELDLSYNKFSSIPLCLNKHTLTSLILADNQIASVRQLPVFEHIKKLDLRRNAIASFDEIDEIARKFPNLNELRINDCPVFENLTSEEMTMHLIGRLFCEPWAAKSTPNFINKLNGTFLSHSEITNAELYFISKVKSGHFSISNTERWKQLVMKYDIHESVRTQISSDDRKIVLSIRKASNPDHELFSRVFLQRNSVLRLKGVVSKHIAKYILDFSIYYYVNDDQAYGTRQILSDDIASLQSLGLSQNHRIYVL
ncbi:hypothetical protein OXX80_003688 [Metschnikowia pulcherrima]